MCPEQKLPRSDPKTVSGQSLCICIKIGKKTSGSFLRLLGIEDSVVIGS